MAAPTQHSSHGPSTWARLVKCPGSVAAQAGQDDPDRFESAQGTFFHEIVSDVLDLGILPEDMIGFGFRVAEWDFVFDAEMAEHCREGVEWIRAKAAEPGWQLFVEKRVDISPWTLPDQFGTADVILVNVALKAIIVFDWKYGMEAVYPFDNWQLTGYCLGVWQSIVGPLFGHDPTDVEVQLVIEQPRVAGAGGVWLTDMVHVLRRGEKVRRASQQSVKPNAPRRAGKDQCRWCRAKSSCAEFAEFNLEAVGLTLDALDGPLIDEFPPEITPERRGELIKMAPMIRDWLAGLAEAAKRDAERGDPTPGHKLVAGNRPRRKYYENALHKAETVLYAELGDKAYGKRELLSPSQAEKALGKSRYADLLRRYVDVGQPTPTLVSDEDGREALPSFMDTLPEIDM